MHRDTFTDLYRDRRYVVRRVHNGGSPYLLLGLHRSCQCEPTWIGTAVNGMPPEVWVNQVESARATEGRL